MFYIVCYDCRTCTISTIISLTLTNSFGLLSISLYTGNHAYACTITLRCPLWVWVFVYALIVS